MLSRDRGAIQGDEPGTQPQENPNSHRQWLLCCGLMAAGYFLAGRLGQSLAIRPDYATVVWPASGIALAGMLLAGYRVWPGLFVGAMLVNNWNPLIRAESISELIANSPLPIAISTGAVIQASLGTFLIRRFVGFPNALIHDRLVLRFLALGGPLSCLVGATVGVLALRLADAIDASQVGLNWLTWWVGDTVGVIIFAPLMIICLAEPRRIWRPRLLSVALPLAATFAAAVAAFVWIQAAEQSNLRSRFDQFAANASRQLQERLLVHLDAVYALEGLYAGGRNVRHRQFASFNRRSLNRHAGTEAIAWLPRIEQAERSDHEARMQHNLHGDYQISERSADRSYVAAAEREEYYPVYYLEPLDSTWFNLGFDLASIPALRAAMAKCCDSNQYIATGPIRLAAAEDERLRVVVFAPIYSKDEQLIARADRKEFLRGFVAAVLSVGDIVQDALLESESRAFDLTIVDKSSAGEPVVYAQPNSPPSKRRELVPLSNQQIVAARSIRFADRDWLCMFRPTRDFFADWPNRNTWWVFLSGLLVTATLGAFLLILSGRTARIEASESRYLDLYEQAPDMFISIDVATQRIIQCNKTFLEATGFTREQIVDRHLYDLFDADSRKEVRRARELFLESGEAKDIELRLVCSDGRLLETSMNVLAIRDDQSQSTLCRAVLRDITAKKSVEAQIKQQEQELAHVARLSLMGEMATGLAHEINQPLAAIAAYAEGAAIRIRDGNPDNASLQRVLSRIAADAHRAGEVISRLRQFVRNQEPDRREIDLNELVREVAQFVGPDVKQRDVWIGLDLQEPLPAVSGDAVQIQQVLLNLVRNGCDAMADVDPLRRQVTIRTRQNGENEVELSVDDCGPGLPQGVDLKVFEAFFTTKEDGLGLGLAISRSIVESHGGRIWATPNLDGGTSFQFSLPATNGVPQDDC